jgi:hypothetical protein
MNEGGAHAIARDVYDVDAKTLARLDVLEGHPRYYRRVPIKLADGSSAETSLLMPRGGYFFDPLVISGCARSMTCSPDHRGSAAVEIELGSHHGLALGAEVGHK